MIFFSLVHSKVCFAVALHLTVGAVSRGESIACAAAGRGAQSQQQRHAATSAPSPAGSRHHQRRRRLQPEDHAFVAGVQTWLMTFLEPILGLNVVGRAPLTLLRHCVGTPQTERKMRMVQHQNSSIQNDCLRFCGFCHKGTKQASHSVSQPKQNQTTVHPSHQKAWNGETVFDAAVETPVHMSKTAATCQF